MGLWQDQAAIAAEHGMTRVAPRLGARVITAPLTLYRSLMAEMGARTGDPEIDQWRTRNEPNIQRGLGRLAIAEEHGIQMALGLLRVKRFNTSMRDLDELVRLGLAPWECGTEVMQNELENWVKQYSTVTPFGLASARVVTTAGVNFLVDALQGSVEPEVMRYHGIGTTNTAEAAADTTLAAELSTVYNPDNTRATGSLTEGASANIFRTVGTNAVDGSAAIVEHGLFSQAASSGGTLLDRSIFAAVNLVSGNTLQTTYDFTITAGS